MLMVGATGGALLLVVGVMVLVVRRSVHRPIRSLTRTLAALGTGDYSARYENGEISEFAYLGNSVNKMAQELQRANAELVEWAQTLERRVEEKTAELRQAQDQMMKVERMASLGKLAAVVAHEINNPLASVVTYSKVLLRRYAHRPDQTEETRESLGILEAIASESARCGEIVSNLLLFARRTGTRMEPTNVNQLVDRSLFLIKHKMDLAQVKADLDLSSKLPLIMCDPAQIEQALLALVHQRGGGDAERGHPHACAPRRPQEAGSRSRSRIPGSAYPRRCVPTSSSRSSRPRARVRGRGSGSASRLSTASCSDTMGRSMSRASRGGGPVSP